MATVDRRRPYYVRNAADVEGFVRKYMQENGIGDEWELEVMMAPGEPNEAGIVPVYIEVNSPYSDRETEEFRLNPATVAYQACVDTVKRELGDASVEDKGSVGAFLEAD